MCATQPLQFEFQGRLFLLRRDFNNKRDWRIYIPKLSAILDELLSDAIDPVALLADSVILFGIVAMGTDVLDDELVLGLAESTLLGLDCPLFDEEEEAVLGREI